MKIKLKMDKRAILDFFVQHVEKIVFGGGLVCFALIVYGPTAREQLSRTPDELVNRALRASQSWENTPADATAFTTDDYPAIASLSRARISVESYMHQGDDGQRQEWKPWDAPLVAQGRKRGEPLLYPLAGLRGTAGHGRVLMNTEAGNLAAASQGFLDGGSSANPIRGQRWVVLTALVPVQKQIQAFLSCFTGCIGAAETSPEAQLPEYVTCQVQRVEVDGSTGEEPPDWTQSESFYSHRAMEEALRLWSARIGTLDEVVSERFVDEVLTFPLPPLEDPQWGESAAYYPEIPLRDATTQEPVDSRDAEPEIDRFDDPLLFGEPSPFSSLSGESGRSSESGLGDGEGYLPSEGEQPVEYSLFRFFDLNVQPGRHYQYRVRFFLKNPNYDLPDNYLSDEVLDKRRRLLEQIEEAEANDDASAANRFHLQLRYLLSDWSDPTSLVSVPRESRLLAVSVQDRPSSAPEGTVLLVSWVNEQGIEAFTERGRIGRGEMANFPACPFPETSSPVHRGGTARGSRAGTGIGDGGGTSAMFDSSSEPVLVDHITDTLMLDMHGGQRLPGRDALRRPGAMLLLDPDGTLVVRRELDDLAECNEVKRQSLSAERSIHGNTGGRFGSDSGSGGNLESLRVRRRGGS